MSTTEDQLRRRDTAKLAAMLSATFMVTLDFFIVNVAAPSIEVDLEASSQELQLVVATYGIAYAAGLLIGGRLGDQYGQKRLFCLGMAAFAAASAACGLAPNIELLIVSRLIQGAAAALMAPQVLALARTQFDQASLERAYLGYGIALGLGSGTGQLVGGAVISADLFGLGWRSCFLINLPLAAASLLTARAVLEPDRSRRSRHLDWMGAVQIASAMLLLVVPLIEGRSRGWPVWVWLSLAASAVLSISFVKRQYRVDPESAIVHPRLLNDRRFRLGLATVIAFYGGVASFFLVLSVYLQRARGLSPITSGLTFSIMVVGFLASTFRPPRPRNNLGVSSLLLGGLITAAGHLLLRSAIDRAGTDAPLAWIVVPLIVVGAGLGLVMSPLVASVLRRLEAAHAGTASGALASAQQLGNSIGVALLGIIFFKQSSPTATDVVDALERSHIALAVLAVAVSVMLYALDSDRGARRPESANAE